MPALTDNEIDSLLSEPGRLVRIATVDADGAPRVVPLWFIRVGNEVMFTPRTAAIVYLNLLRDPRVGMSIDEEQPPYRKVTIQGVARLVHPPGDDDAWRDLYRDIAGRYVPRESADAYVDGTADQPRALYSVALGEPNRVMTWRMPIPGENPVGIWAKRYYVPGTR